MNLRKDHSHISTFNPVNLSCEGLCRMALRSSCGGDARGWWGACRQLGLSWRLLVPTTIASSHGYLNASLCQWLSRHHSTSQLSAMDVSVRSTMKGAAKCDKHCELQNSVNRQGLERILCFWDIPESMPASVSMLCCSSSCSLLRGMLLRSLVPQGAPLVLLRHSMHMALLRQPAS